MYVRTYIHTQVHVPDGALPHTLVRLTSAADITTTQHITVRVQFPWPDTHLQLPLNCIISEYGFSSITQGKGHRCDMDHLNHSYHERRGDIGSQMLSEKLRLISYRPNVLTAWAGPCTQSVLCCGKDT